MATRYRLKERFDVESKFGAFFTGSEIAWTKDGTYLLCQNEKELSLLDLEQGQVTGILGSNSDSFDAEAQGMDNSEDAVTAFTESATGNCIYTSHRCKLFRKWSRADRKLLKSWKSFHKGPIAKLAVSAEGKWLASGGTDSCVRLWDLETYNCVHTLRGCQGVISVLKFRPCKSEVFAAGDDRAIRCWEIGKSTPRLTLSSHYSTVTALEFHTASGQMISLEAMVLLPSSCTLPGNLKAESGIHVATAGERGVVRIWQIERAKEVYVQNNSQIAASAEPGGLAIINMMFNEAKNTLAVVSADHNIIFHRLDTFVCDKLLAGFFDEILDVAFLGTEESHLAVASNSPDMKLFRIKDMHCQLLRGHTNHVLSLAVSKASPYLLSSAAKDNTVRVWSLDPESEKVTCIAVGDRHTAHVGAVAMTHLSADWLLSAGQDECLKLWKLPNFTDAEDPINLVPEYTEKAHTKDINCVCISPNDKIIVSTSQDKTAKILSASADGLVKLWTIKIIGSNEKRFVTGGADSKIVIWKDTTVEHKEAEIKAHQEKVIGEQRLANLMQAEEYDEALELALKLNRPNNALKVVESIIYNKRDLGAAILKLSTENQHVLVKFALRWNMNTRTYRAGLDVLHFMVIEGVVPLTAEEIRIALLYSQKHYERVTQLKIDLQFSHYVVEQMSLAASARNDS
ncbi:hypothetical protein B566_EDAN006215 [Ephemera danica]|nr:hypothetical protein B566_EDAN006215 [Ephemera danica]